MDMFERHELVKTQNGYELVLYMEKQTSEFGEEFFRNLTNKTQELQKEYLDDIRKLVNDKYRDIKIDTVKIMLGSLLIASIGYSAVEAAAANVSSEAVQAQANTLISYTVKAGDTLYNIAQKTGTSVEQLMKLNSLNSYLIFPGQQLKTQETAKAQNQNAVYTVQAKDTLYSISKKLNTSVANLKKLNNLVGDIIYPGQKLKLTATTAPTAPTTPTAPAATNLILVNKKNSLAASYVPSLLVNPNVPSVDKAKTKMAPEAAKALEALFAKAKQDNISLTAISGYRSYEYQNSLFASNVKKYGSMEAANQFSAKPGQSEHQTGLAMDVSSPSVNNTLTQSFAQTKEGKWLKENAPKYGFIIRYNKGKESITGYQFEPWHLRYVGNDTASAITSKNITLEEYLGRV